MRFTHRGGGSAEVERTATRRSSFAERFAFFSLVLLALGMPYERLTPLLRGPGIVITNLEALIFLTLIGWGSYRLVALWNREALRATRFALPLAWMLGIALLAALTTSDDRLNALKGFGRLLTGVAVFFATFDLCVSPRRVATLSQALAVSGWVVALLGLLETLRIPPVLRFLDQFRAIPATFGGAMRVSSTLASANPAALVLAVTGCLTLGWMLHALQQRSSRGIALWGTGAIAVVTTLVLTLSRGGLLAFAVGGSALMVANRRHIRRRWLAIASLTGLLAIGALLMRSETLRVRLTELGNRTGFDVEYRGPAIVTLPPGGQVTIPITLINTGKRTWTATGDNAVRLGVHWLGAEGTDIRWEGARVPLPTSVMPGGRVTVSYPLQAPSRPGRYVLAWDLVQGKENWFAYWWVETGQTKLVVVPGASAVLGPEMPLRQTLSLPPQRMPRPSPQRLELWNVALRIGMERPWFGVGPDNFRLVYGSYLGWEDWDVRLHAHSLYLEFLADTGWPGLVAWLWITLMSLQTAYRLLRSPPLPGHAGIGAALLAWWTHNLVDVFIWATPTYVLFWMLLGVSAAADQDRTRGREARAEQQRSREGRIQFP